MAGPKIDVAGATEFTVAPVKPLFSAPESAEPPPAPPEPPISGAVRTTFRFLYLALVVLVFAWLASGVKSVEPGYQAVVLRAGAIDRVAPPGLVLAWPRPIEEIVLLPGPERQLTLEVTKLDLKDRANAPLAVNQGIDPRRDGGFVLTGDSGVIHLKGNLAWRVDNPREFVLNRDKERLEPALTRLFCAAAIGACARRSLDGVLVVGSGDAGNTSEAAKLALREDQAQNREKLRADLLADINRRARDLHLGVVIARVDLTAFLPDRAKPAFDNVVAAESAAARDVADARTDAAKMAQDAQVVRGSVLARADAQAREQISAARVATDQISALAAESSPERRSLLLTRLYRDRLEGILRKAGSVITVDGRDPVRILVPGR